MALHLDYLPESLSGKAKKGLAAALCEVRHGEKRKEML